MEKEKFNPCCLSIIKTLSYSCVFNYPLSFYQISTNLISDKYYSGKKIRKELKDLEERKVIEHKDGRYYLKQVTPVDWKEREAHTKEILKDNDYILNRLKKIPWIKMMALTGSSANYNMDNNADIDLLFVTRKNRLWLTRGLVFFMLVVLNKLPKDNSKRKICPNIFIDERLLPWAKKRRNLYIAQNIISMQPIINRDNTYFMLMEANKWVNKYFNNFKVCSQSNFQNSNNTRGSRSSRSFFLRLVEKSSMFLQVIYMKRKMSKEIATDKLIHFNKNDNSGWILSKYKKILKSVV